MAYADNLGSYSTVQRHTSSAFTHFFLPSTIVAPPRTVSLPSLCMNTALQQVTVAFSVQYHFHPSFLFVFVFLVVTITTAARGIVFPSMGIIIASLIFQAVNMATAKLIFKFRDVTFANLIYKSIYITVANLIQCLRQVAVHLGCGT